MATEAQRKARNKYNNENNLNKTITFNRKTETDLVEFIEKLDEERDNKSLESIF